MKEVILIDLKNLAYRMHFSHANLMSSDGKHTGVLHGSLQGVLSIHKRFPDSPIVFCSEDGPSWRKDFAPGLYKANRKPSEDRERIREQIPKLYELLDIIGFNVVFVDGLEADDLISIFARKFADRYYKVRIVSNDKDFYQLLSKKRKAEIFRYMDGRAKPVRALDVFDEYGVLPEYWASFRALSGDPSDNIKALAGVGPKTAVKFLEGGIRPAFPKFEDHFAEVQKRFPQLQKNWSMVHTAWILSRLPRTVTEVREHIGDKKADRLKNIVGRIVNRPKRHCDMPETAQEAFVEACASCELTTMISKRHKFFQIP